MLARESKDGLAIEFFNKKGWEYDIPIQDVVTRRGLIRWIRHLSEKNWITTEHIKDLIDLSNSLVSTPGYDRSKKG